MLCSLLRDLRYCLTQGSSHKAASLTHANEMHMLSLDGGLVCHIHIGVITSKLKEWVFLCMLAMMKIVQKYSHNTTLTFYIQDYKVNMYYICMI